MLDSASRPWTEAVVHREPPVRRRASWWRIGGLVLREAVSRRRLERAPEPPVAVDEFDSQGGCGGGLEAIYHFNALATHALAPRGATVVDLGCGPARFLCSLAARRPDLHLVGLDLDPRMLAAARRNVAALGLEGRVEVREADMTTFAASASASTAVVTSLFALHHLESRASLAACLGQIAQLRRRTGAAVWLFDHARPKARRTAERFPEVFTPDAAAAFKKGSTDSLVAAWTLEEVREAAHGLGGLASAAARVLSLYQVHWVAGRAGGEGAELVEPPDAPYLRDASALAALFRGRLPVPQAPGARR